MRSEEKKRRVTVYTSVIIYIGQYDQNDRNAIKRYAPPGPQKSLRSCRLSIPLLTMIHPPKRLSGFLGL